MNTKEGLVAVFLIGILSLMVLTYALTFINNSQANFDSGTYNFTFYNSSGFVQLNSSRLNGSYVSQIFNAGSNANWTNISWLSNALGELPNNQINEITSNAFGSENINMTGNVLLMHLNEVSGTIVDSSGNDNNGTTNGVTYSASGKLNTALSFDGLNDNINISDKNYFSPSVVKNFTVSAWVKFNSVASYSVIVSKGTTSNYEWALELETTTPRGLEFITWTTAGATHCAGGSYSAPQTNRWYHLVGVIENGHLTTSNCSIYIDGLFNSSNNLLSSNSLGNGNSIVRIGERGDGVGDLNGTIDEVAIWNRSLSATEILNIYKRGAERLNLSVQSCDDSACSGESWTNLGSNLTSPQNINVTNNSYFQYKFDFLTDNISYTPELYNVTINYDLLDLDYPSVNLNSPVNGFNTTLTNINFNFTMTDMTSPSGNCSLYLDSVYINNNASVSNGTATILNYSGISAGLHYWNVSCKDSIAGNQNWSETRSFFIDLTAPTVSNIVYSPNSTDNVDPGTNITINATLTDNRVSVSSVILQYYNGTGWSNKTMTNNSATNYNTTITTISAEANYTFDIWSNDSLGNSNQSSNQTFNSTWDCTWTATSDLGQAIGWNENKGIGNISINNTGDSAYSISNCSLDFRFTYDLTEGRIFYDNEYIKPSDTYAVSAKSNLTISINATFLSEVKQENAIVTSNEFRGRSLTSSRNTTLILVSNTGGPYLYQKLTSSPGSVYLTHGNFSLYGYMRNLMGGSTVNENNTAYNVSFYWTLPSGLTNLTGNLTVNFTNITDSNLHYNSLNVTFSSLASFSAGVKTITLSAYGYNLSGSTITHAGNITILTEPVNVTFLCYNTSDGIYVTSCGSLDGDYTAPTSEVASSAGVGGGGAGNSKSSESIKTSADYQLVRGKQNEVEVKFKNKDQNKSIKNVKISVTGKISKYVNVIPKEISLFLPGEEITATLKITSPSYLSLGKQELVIKITGEKGDITYVEEKKITLEVHELSGAEAEEMLNKSRVILGQLETENLSSAYFTELVNQSQEAINIFDYEKVRDNYKILKDNLENALKAKKTIEELEVAMQKSEEKGIDTSNSLRLLKLAKLSLERREFEQAATRVRDAQVAYALEIKGEIGKLSYYVKEYKSEISVSALMIGIFSFGSYKLLKLQRLKRKIKYLQKEEKILQELMQVVQDECFKKKTISMEEYETAMEQYQNKMSDVIEELIELETKRVYVFKSPRESKRLKIERERIIQMIKNLQADYMKNKKIETRAYEVRLKSYNRRLADIDERLAVLEAKRAFKGELK